MASRAPRSRLAEHRHSRRDSVLPKPSGVDRRAPFVRGADLRALVLLPFLWLIAWFVPERGWPFVCRTVVRATRHPHRARRAAIVRALGQGGVEMAHAQSVEYFAGYLCDLLQLLREYRPGGWEPAVEISGAEHIREALAGGRGAVIWVVEFANGLYLKKALHDAGFDVHHLSGSAHGFSDSRVAKRLLNPIWWRVEERYLASRILLTGHGGTVGAVREVRSRLRANELVSISMAGKAAKVEEVPFFDTTLRLPTTPMSLALSTGAAILPAVVLERRGRPTVAIEPALLRHDGSDSLEALARSAAEVLERHVRAQPHLWRAWRLARVA